MTNKARLANLAQAVQKKPVKAAIETTEELVANKPHGDKGDHIKVTVTLPPEVYKVISDEVARRKMTKQPNPQISAVVREAVVAMFGGKEH